MKTLIASSFISALVLTGPAIAADKYVLDPSHSQIVFEYGHLGFSTTFGMFSGFTGELAIDEENPANSTVAINIDTKTLITGWDARTAHFLGEDFFDAAAAPVVTFTSTKVDLTGENSAVVTGDLTMNGVTKAVSIDAELNGKGMHPQAKKEWIGFDGKTTIKRSDFDMGAFAPYVTDEVVLNISIEAGKE